MKLINLKSAMLLIAACAAPTVVQADEYYEVNVMPNPSRIDYRKGEVLVKFKTESAVSVKRNAKGKFQTSGITAIDKAMQQLGAADVEPLMPLTGQLQPNTPRKLKALNGTEVEVKDLSKLYRIRFSDELDVHEAVSKLRELDEVEFAEPNYIAYICSTDQPNDPLYQQQWGIPAIKANKLWSLKKVTDKRPVIAILDTGVDITHPDLVANLWTNSAELSGSEGYDDDENGFIDDIHGWDFVNESSIIDDYNGHGTHCAGIAAATGDNGIGICGANPDALIMPLTVMQSDGTGDVGTIVKGIDYALAHGADVFSMSFGTVASVALQQSLARAYTSSILVAAAGNGGSPICRHFINGGPIFPAAFAFVYGVQASDESGNHAGFSNFDNDGPIYFHTECFNEEEMYNYEVWAPGTNILSTYPGGKYKTLSGTSMACPLVAGALSRFMQSRGLTAGQQDQLMGDLIHVEDNNGVPDFEKLYNLKDSDRAPYVHLISWRMEDETDHDQHYDAGEIINLYPTLRNDWGQAKNIRTWIELAENEKNVIEILTDHAAFDKPLSSYAKAESANPIRFRINDDVVDGRHCRIVFYAQCDGMAEPYKMDYTFEAENGVEIGGILEKDLTLVPGVHYIMTRSVIVPKGINFNIEPGVTIKVSDGEVYFEDGVRHKFEGTAENPIIFTKREGGWGSEFKFQGADFKYCVFDQIDLIDLFGSELTDCIISECHFKINTTRIQLNRSNILDSGHAEGYMSMLYYGDLNLCNLSGDFRQAYLVSNITPNANNFLDNPVDGIHKYIMGEDGKEVLIRSDHPSYYGSAVEKTVRKKIWDFENPEAVYATWKYDLSNMLKQPHPDAHGALWKVMIDGYDAQDEFDLLPPLGVGKHKVEVWYSKKIDESEKPSVSMGVRPPYTQVPFNSDGSWRTEHVKFNPYPDFRYNDFTNGAFEGESGWSLDGIGGWNFTRNDDIVVSENDYNDGSGVITNSCIAMWARNDLNEKPYDVTQVVDPIANGVYKFRIGIAPTNEIHLRGENYIYANGDKTYITSDQPAYYEVTTTVTDNRLEVGCHIEGHYLWGYTYFDNAELTLIEEAPLESCIRDLEVSVYSTDFEIKGNMAIDGLNRIYVVGCKDLEHFDIPYENTRFNVEVSAAGSLSTGFMATPGIGKVDLEWDNQNSNIDDVIGYNLYRITDRVEYEWGYNDEWEWVEKPVLYQDTIRVNKRLINEEKYTDFDVVPGVRYNYYYKVLRTDMSENSPSKVVSVVPLTAKKGDANGSFNVDVADIVTEISYMTGGDPQPFIFDAADVNEDTKINILDVVGTINIIINPSTARIFDYGTARYWIDNNVLWVDSDVALGGVQFLLNNAQSFSTLEALNGFETVSQQTEEGMIFLAYSMIGRTIEPGMHALLKLDSDVVIDNATFSDPTGANVMAMGTAPDSLNGIFAAQMSVPTPNPFYESVAIPYSIGNEGQHNVELIFTDLTGRVVDTYATVCEYGTYTYTWTPQISSGVYMVSIIVDGKQIQTAKLIKK